MTDQERNQEREQRNQDCKDNHKGDENGHFHQASRRTTGFFCRHCNEFATKTEGNRRWFAACGNKEHGAHGTCFKATR
jgi:hypothetical protein